MSEALDQLKRELEEFSRINAATETDRTKRMQNITRDTGEMLSVLVRATKARDILEIGTSNGYSTLWLAEAAKAIGGRVTTVEVLKSKQELALENFRRSGLSTVIDSILGDAGQVLREQADESRDMIFLDSDRSSYECWWPDLKRVLRPGGLLVVDNAVSPPDPNMVKFWSLLRDDREFTVCLVPVGKGELLATKALNSIRSD